MNQYWKISDFAKEIGKHVNTVDGWFKKLEERNIHYINRTDNEKIYEELDVRIGVFIKKQRDKKWSLEGIFNELPNHFELRPFPPDAEPASPQTIDLHSLKQELLREIHNTADKISRARMERLQSAYDELLKALPEAKSKEEEREERIHDLLLRRQIEEDLETEALTRWNTLPLSERQKRALFLRVEDTMKRERFVKAYVNIKFEEKLRKSLI
ncbi:MerR family transcriptional regulator [Thalassorhabdus alkalitolerans]|uniref:MerR family transcriptional regulator n=1 Tax=Thalassorhabdus alkalitolerans TaxID=2282697 RepID=A0ABW0YQ35_9BACI